MILDSNLAAAELSLDPPTTTPMHALLLLLSRSGLIGALGVILAMFISASAIADASASISFDRDIAPLLTSRCAKCHGPSEGKAGLHLTDRDAATVTLPSGERAIVPGKPDESELLRRVASTDPEVRMPPKGLPLSADEIAKLRRWIADGAVWPAHWAYRPLI